MSEIHGTFGPQGPKPHSIAEDAPPSLLVTPESYAMVAAFCHKHQKWDKLCWDGARLGPGCCVDHALISGMPLPKFVGGR